jgi:opacity protein-like surface antigen
MITSKNIFGLMLMISIICIIPCGASSQTATPSAEEDEYEVLSPNILMIDLGYGSNEMSAGLGFRYSFNNTPFGLGVMVGLTGFTITLPPYRRTTGIAGDVIPKGVVKETFSKLVISTDLMAFFDVSDRFSLFGSVGYYSQSDTILYKNPQDNLYYLSNNYQDQYQSSSSLCLGTGFQYFLTDKVTLGLAYHTKLGIYAQLGYAWY